MRSSRASWTGSRPSARRAAETAGHSHDDALAATIDGLHRAEVSHRPGPWKSFEAVEFATLEWVDGFNTRRLREAIDDSPPAEAEAAHHPKLEANPTTA